MAICLCGSHNLKSHAAATVTAERQSQGIRDRPPNKSGRTRAKAPFAVDICCQKTGYFGIRSTRWKGNWSMKTCPPIIKWISLLFLVTSWFHFENASGQRKLFEDDEPAVEGGAKTSTAPPAVTQSTDVEFRLDEIKLGELPDGDKFYASKFSEDGCHIACVVKKGSKQLVALDGRTGPEFDAVQNVSISPDGSRVGYWAKKDGKAYVVVDHQIGQQCDKADIVFSQDGKHVACLVRKGGKAFVVIDGKAGPEFGEVKPFTFSANGNRFVYKAATGDGYFFFVDGKLGPKAATYGGLYFSPDGSRLALGIAERFIKDYYVVDGVKEQEYDRITELAFSPNGNHYAYAAQPDKNADYVVAMDGKPRWPGYDNVRYLTFSPDGTRLAYVASRGADEEFVVVNGEPGPSFREVCKYIGQLAFSPDSKHLAYVASPSILVYDGKQQEPKYRMMWGVAFSPDSAHLAYKAAEGRKEFVVVDGKPGPKNDKLSFEPLCFRADGVVEYLAYRDGSYYRVKQSSPAWVTSEVHKRTGTTETTTATTTERTIRSSLFEDDGPVQEKQIPPLKTVPSTRPSSLFEDEEPAPTPGATEVGTRRSPLFDDEGAGEPTKTIPGEPSQEGPTAYRVVEERIGEISRGPFLRGEWSRDRLHVAYKVTAGEKRWFIAFDGKLGPEFEEVGDPVLSENGLHVAYTAWQGNKGVAVVDHTPGPRFDSVRRPKLSSDGSHVAYPASEGGKWFVVVDGKRGPEFDAIEYVQMTSDGAHVAYKARQGRKYLVVLDGKTGPAHDELYDLGFSPDGARVAYEAKDGGNCFAVLDGQRGPAWDDVRELTFSPDGKRFVCQGKQNGKWRMVVDGRAGPPFDQLARLTFSPDCTRVAYVGRNNIMVDGKRDMTSVVVVDGKPGPVHQFVLALRFSPDGRHIAYVAQKNDKEFVVYDGQVGPEFDDINIIGVSLLVFSPDSQHLVYHGGYKKKDGTGYDKYVLVMDGKVVSQVESTSDVAFSPDGERFAYGASKSADEEFVVVDGKPGPVYPFVTDLTFSPDGRRFAYAGLRADRTFDIVVDGKLVKTEYRHVRGLLFSPDSRHYAYAGTPTQDSSQGPWLCVVDGQPGPGYADLRLGERAFHVDGTLEYVTYRDQDLYRAKHILTGEVASARLPVFPGTEETQKRRTSLFEDDDTQPPAKTGRSGLFDDDEPQATTGTKRPSFFEDDGDVSKGPSAREQTSPSSRRIVTTTSLKARRYTRTHKWVSLRGAIAVVGITDFAPSKIGDVVSVELPRVGEKIVAGGECAQVEFVIATIGIDSPLSGEIVGVNEKLKDKPELLSSDPYGEGWILEVRPSDLSELWLLMDAAQYQKMTKEQ